MIVYDSLCIFSQVAAYMNFAVQVFNEDCMSSSAPCVSLYAKWPSPSRNQSNTVQNETLKEDLCFGSYFRFVRHESKTFCSEFDISTKDTLALRPGQQHASSIKLYHPFISNRCCILQSHSCTLKCPSTLMYC